MKIDRKIFVGYDSTTPEPFYVCRQSLINCGVSPDIIHPLLMSVADSVGWYWRDPAHKASTEFTYTRFLVPFLSGFYGQSIFCDSDFLWRHNPEILFDLMDAEPEHAVRVVKHEIAEADLVPVKMNGKLQEWYPKKNWSSLMVFNNAHLDCRNLIPATVSESAPSWLHQLDWTNNVGPSLPKSFNYLVGYGYDVKDPYAVHFTDGGPWLDNYKNVEYAKEWFDVQQKTERPVY